MLTRANTPQTPSAAAFFLSPERKADWSGEASKSCGSYYLSDHLGSTRAVVDDAGNVLETFDYYPFGLLMPKRSSTTGNTIEKFTGKERDTEGNLISQTGKFTDISYEHRNLPVRFTLDGGDTILAAYNGGGQRPVVLKTDEIITFHI